VASGMFPLRPGDEGYEDLARAANLVESVLQRYWDWVGDDGQYDNAAADGGSLALLKLAVRLIRDEIQS